MKLFLVSKPNWAIKSRKQRSLCRYKPLDHPFLCFRIWWPKDFFTGWPQQWLWACLQEYCHHGVGENTSQCWTVEIQASHQLRYRRVSQMQCFLCWLFSLVKWVARVFLSLAILFRGRHLYSAPGKAVNYASRSSNADSISLLPSRPLLLVVVVLVVVAALL